MEESGRAALGRFVLSTKEHLVLLRPTGGMLALETLYYPEDVRIRDQREVAERLEGVEVSKEELAMAEQLVEGLAKPFKPEEYPNETRAALLEFLEAKAAGEEIAEPEEAREPAPGRGPHGGAQGQPRGRGGGRAAGDARATTSSRSSRAACARWRAAARGTASAEVHAVQGQDPGEEERDVAAPPEGLLSPVRRDPLTGEPVLLAPARAARPHDVGRPATGAGCPFCPGNEAETPPETQARPPGGGPPDGPGLAGARDPQQVPGASRPRRASTR